MFSYINLNVFLFIILFKTLKYHKILLGQALLSYALHKVWDINMTFDLKFWPINLNINREEEFLSYPFCKVWDTYMTFDLDLMTWISQGTNIASRTINLPLLKLLDQTILRNYWFIVCTMLGYTGMLSYKHTYRQTNLTKKICQVICPPPSKEGILMF